MDAAVARDYLLAHPEAAEDFPFGPDVAVFKISGKMFATLGYQEGAAQINLKCDPQEALFLRDMFEAVRPGYHMNKTHWNTVILDGSVPLVELERMMDRSYGLVVKGMKKVDRNRLITAYGQDAVYR